MKIIVKCKNGGAIPTRGTRKAPKKEPKALLEVPTGIEPVYAVLQTAA